MSRKTANRFFRSGMRKRAVWSASGSMRSGWALGHSVQKQGVTAMVAAVRVHKTGGPEVLTFEDVQVPAPGPGQLKVKNHACGVNFIDTYFRMGMYAAPAGLPFISGNEGAGEVTAAGPGVTDIKVGD